MFTNTLYHFMFGIAIAASVLKTKAAAAIDFSVY
jgi:hypothetical protein